MARGRRVCAGRRRHDRRPEGRAVHDHPAAAQRHRLAASRPCATRNGRGRADPPCPDARPTGAVPAGSRPRLDRSPVRARSDPRGRGREPADARPRPIPRADAGVRPRGHPRPGAPSRGIVRLEPPPLHDGRRLGDCRPSGIQDALRPRPRLPHRGAHQLVPGLPDERQRPRGGVDAGDGHAVVGPIPPPRRGEGSTGPEPDDHRRDHEARDDPRRYGRRGPSGRRPLHRPRRTARPDPVRRA